MPRTSFAERRKRLVILADWLEKRVLPQLNGVKFNMRVWAQTKNKVSDKVLKTKSIAAAKECGYAGCALGWALFSPKLRKEGVGRLIEEPLSFEDKERKDFFVNEKKAVDFFGLGGWSEFDKAFCGPGVGQKGIVKVAKLLREIANSPVDRTNF